MDGEDGECSAGADSFVCIRGVADVPVIAILRCQAVETTSRTLCEKAMTDAVAALLLAVVLALAESWTHENVIFGVVGLTRQFFVDELVAHDLSDFVLW